MKKILVLYATTDGHTRKIAQRIAETAVRLGSWVDVVDAKLATPDIRPENYDLVIVSASVHVGGYQRAMGRWVRHHTDSLRQRPSLFVSVCLGVLENRPQTQAAGEKILEKFYAKSGWHPTATKQVAGAIPFTRYNFIKKWIMKRIARKVNAGADTSRDYEYTDWLALDSFTREFVTTGDLAPVRTMLTYQGTVSANGFAYGG